MEMLSSVLILFEIISRLPSRFVTQCKVVCKEWNRELSTFEFARVHGKYTGRLTEQKLISVSYNSCMVHILNDNHCRYASVRNLSIPFDSCPYTLDILSSFNGLLCVCLNSTGELFLWNPSTGVYNNLYNISNGHGVYALYLDCIGMFVDSNYDHKVVHIKRRCDTVQACVYSVRSGEWTSYGLINDRPYFGNNYCWSRGTLCGSGLYYVSYNLCVPGNVFIFKFDVNSNLVSEIRVPNDLCSGSEIPPELGFIAVGILVNIRNQLHMFTFSGYIFFSVGLWKFEKDSWSKVITYDYLMRLPLTIRATITYVEALDVCVLTTERGDVFHIDLHGYEDGGFLPLSICENVNASIFSETIVSPCV